MADLNNTMMISASGLKAQSQRMRVIAENMANASSTGDTPGADPYRRRIPTFGNVVDRELGVNMVEVKRIVADRSEFGLKFDPSHPAANEDGYVKTPNVKGLVETMDMHEAQRSYEANLNTMDAARTMAARTLDLLK
ncbi:MAG: flagellar basal body rod protein FlgC [Pseudomonadota bacterium]